MLLMREVSDADEAHVTVVRTNKATRINLTGLFINEFITKSG